MFGSLQFNPANRQVNEPTQRKLRSRLTTEKNRDIDILFSWFYSMFRKQVGELSPLLPADQIRETKWRGKNKTNKVNHLQQLYGHRNQWSSILVTVTRYIRRTSNRLGKWLRFMTRPKKEFSWESQGHILYLHFAWFQKYSRTSIKRPLSGQLPENSVGLGPVFSLSNISKKKKNASGEKVEQWWL